MLRVLVAAAVERQRRALGDALLDVGEHLLAVRLRDDRAHRHAGLEAVADLDLLRLVHELLDHDVVGGADAEHDAVREAALAGAAEARLGAHLRGARHVGVRHHEHEVLRAAQGLHALALLGAALVDVVRDRRAADERHAGDARVVEDARPPRPSRRAPGSRRPRGSRHSCSSSKMRLCESGTRSLGLTMNVLPQAIACGRNHIGHHRREVERRDRREHAHRLAVGVAVDAGRDVLERAALHGGRDRRSPARCCRSRAGCCCATRRSSCRARRVQDAARGPRSSSRTARFSSNSVPHAVHRRRRAPRGEGLRGGLARRVHVGRAAQRRAREQFVRRRVADVAERGRGGVDPAAADVSSGRCGRRSSRRRRRAWPAPAVTSWDREPLSCWSAGKVGAHGHRVSRRRKSIAVCAADPAPE